MLCREVLGLSEAPVVICDRIAVALLGSDPRIRRIRTVAGAWCRRRKDPRCWRSAPSRWWTWRRRACARSGSDRITEIAVVVVYGGRREVVFESLVNPGRPIPPAIRAITNISDEMVRSAPRFDEVWRPGGRGPGGAGLRRPQRALRLELRQRRGASGAGPDAGRAEAVYRAAGASAGEGHHLLRARQLSPTASGSRNGARHRAAGDALVTAELLERLLALARDEGARTLQDLAAIESRRAPRRRRRRRSAMPTEPARRLPPEDCRDALAKRSRSAGSAAIRWKAASSASTAARCSAWCRSRSGQTRIRPTTATGSCWPCAACWWSTPTAWC